ncbi:MAG: efflux RND transporter permease subunit, partial [candidate division Zixibacteria bacterium]
MIGAIIKRPVLVSMILIGFSLLGIVSYTRLPVELIPYTELPMLIVFVGSPRDADPALVERQGVIPLESAIAGLEDIERIETFVDRRRAIIFAYYVSGTNLKYAYLKLQQRVQSARSQLGEGFFATVWKVDSEQLSNQFMTLKARGDGSLDQIRQVIDRKVISELENIDGIANAEVFGGRRHSIEVLLDKDALLAQGLTISQVSAALQEGSTRRQYLGQAVEGSKTYFVNLSTDYSDLPDIAETVLKQEGPVLLSHVAEIIDGGAEQESISRVNGKESITISLIRDQEMNLLKLSGETHKSIDRLNERLSSDGVELVVDIDSAEPIENNIQIIKLLALIGGILAVAILWLFLRNLRMVLIVATAMPISVLIALNLFYALDITINTLTLVGIAIAMGMLLDNSVVVLENIHRLMARGRSAYEAVVTGTTEVFRAVLAATMTTVAVFLPFVFSDNLLVSTLGRQIGISIVSTLLVSLVVAFLLIPTFTYRLLARSESGKAASFNVISQSNRMVQIYTLLLKSSLRFPARTVLISVVLFFFSVLLCLLLAVNVAEEVELDSFSLYATLPSGTTLESADEQVVEMDDRLAEFLEIEERLVSVSEDQATFTFKLTDNYEDIEGRDMATVKSEIMDNLESAYRRIDFSYQQPASNSRYRGGGGGGMRGAGRAFERLLGIGTSEEKVVLRGQDMTILRLIADDIQFNIDNLETVRQSELNISTGQPGIDLLLDKTALKHFNVSAQSLVSELSSFQGEAQSGISLRRGAEEIDVILKEDTLIEKTADDLRQLQIPTANSSSIPLMQLSGLAYTEGGSSINRVNQDKHVEIIYQFEEDITDSRQLLESARMEVDQITDGFSPPPGLSIEVIHDETDLSEFYFLIFAGVILIYMILASVFESVTIPLAMMFTLPLATIGAFWGLILTGNSIMNANALIGFLVLLGVVVNNGIILVDYSRVLKKRNYRTSRALMAAGQARLRPILITAITTILAMLPLAMGKAEYVARIGAPFAITVIAGMVAGTLFTLILVPTVSSGMESAGLWWSQLNWRKRLAQILVMAGGISLIYTQVDSTFWKIADVVALLFVIPAATYFMTTSLKRTSRKLIPDGEPIRIRIRNIVKTYDGASRFMRQWRKPERQEHTTSQPAHHTTWYHRLEHLFHLPLYLFTFYFTFVYVESGWWQLFFGVVFYMYTARLAAKVLIADTADGKRVILRRTRKWLHRLIHWALPLAILYWHFLEWNPVSEEALADVILLGICYYIAMAVSHGSKRLYRDKIDINRLKGRFRRTRKAYYRMVRVIPLIGKKKVPFRALYQVSMDIESGMFGLVGPNGAGKTTLMRVICGVLDQTYGKVTVNGIDLTEQREELQSLIGYLPQEFGTYENMTAYQFLDYQALLKGLWDSNDRRDIVERAISSVHLGDSRDRKIGTFSGGMKQRVGIAQTLLHLPRILVVDEPTAGLDPRERIRFRNLLSELSRDRVVIFSTHIIEDVSSSCNRLA